MYKKWPNSNSNRMRGGRKGKGNKTSMSPDALLPQPLMTVSEAGATGPRGLQSGCSEGRHRYE